MTKLMYKFSFVVLFFMFSFSSMIDVKAFEEVAIGGYNLIYHIKSLNIDTGSATMKFEGFSFIDHMDNYGGENLTTWIIATNSSGGVYSVPVSYIDKSAVDDYDYYFARCQETGGADTPCTSEHAEWAKTSNLRRHDCNVGNAADCAYFSVDFVVTIDLLDLFDQLGSESDISFKIKSEVVSAAGSLSRESDLGVYDQRCSVSVNGNINTCNNEIDIGDSSIYVKDTSDVVKVTASKARAKYSNFTSTPAGWYYLLGGEFQVVSYNSNGSFGKGKISFNSDYYVVLGTNNSTVSPGGSTQFIIYDSWVQAPSAIKLSFDGPPPSPTPTYCDPGYTDVTTTTKSVSCNSSAQYRTCIKKNTSTRVPYNVNISEIEHPNHRGDSSKYCGSSTVYSDIGAEILVHQSGTFTYGNLANTVYAGQGFDFPGLTYQNWIYWKYSDSNVSQNTVTFKYGHWNWEIVDSEYSNTETEIKIEGVSPVDPSGNSVLDSIMASDRCNSIRNSVMSGQPSEYTFVCDIRDGVFINGISEQDMFFVIWRVIGPKVIDIWDYVCHEDWNSVTVSYANYMSELNEAAKNTVSDNINESVIQNSTPTSYDSNVVSYTEKQVAGSWDPVDRIGSLNLNSNTYTMYSYDMEDANIKLVGDKVATIAYSDSELNNYKKIGNKYFVPLLFPDGGKFPVNVIYNNISFVNGIYWYLSGNCSIDVINAMYRGNDPKYRYRPIDLDDPFPKGNVPINWVAYYPEIGNRLKNTYDNKIFYSVSLVNGNSANGKLGINQINSDNRQYNSWVGMNASGTSSFINNNGSYFDENNAKSWCEIGKFDVSCDKY